MPTINKLTELFHRKIITKQEYDDGLDALLANNEDLPPQFKPIPTTRKPKPIPTPRKTKQISQVETNITNKELPPKFKKIPVPRNTKQISKAETKISDDTIAFVAQTNNDSSMVKDYTRIIPTGHPMEHDLISTLNLVTPDITTIIHKELERLGGIKFNIVLTAVLERPSNTDDVIESVGYFRHSAIPVTNNNEIDKAISESKAIILKNFENYTRAGSGWTLKRCESVDLAISQYRPFRGSSYIPTPEKAAKTKAIVNVKNKDNRCFE